MKFSDILRLCRDLNWFFWIWQFHFSMKSWRNFDFNFIFYIAIHLALRMMSTRSFNWSSTAWSWNFIILFIENIATWITLMFLRRVLLGFAAMMSICRFDVSIYRITLFALNVIKKRKIETENKHWILGVCTRAIRRKFTSMSFSF